MKKQSAHARRQISQAESLNKAVADYDTAIRLGHGPDQALHDAAHDYSRRNFKGLAYSKASLKEALDERTEQGTNGVDTGQAAAA